MRPHRIKELRIQHRFTQESLAKAVGVSPSTIGGYENTGRLPDLETLKIMADRFGVSLDYLAGYTDVPCTLQDAEKFALTEEEARFMAVYRQLDDAARQQLYAFLCTIVKA